MPKDAKVILFGSRARRDAKADSDWDILVLLNKDKIDEQDHDNYTYPTDSRYFAQKAIDAANELWDKGLIDEETIEQWMHEHMRTPYSEKMQR